MTKAKKEAIRLSKIRDSHKVDLGDINKVITDGFRAVAQSVTDYNRALQEMALVMGNASVSVEAFMEAMAKGELPQVAQVEEAPPPAPPILDEAPADEIKKNESTVGIRAKFLE